MGRAWGGGERGSLGVESDSGQRARGQHCERPGLSAAAFGPLLSAARSCTGIADGPAEGQILSLILGERL